MWRNKIMLALVPAALGSILLARLAIGPEAGTSAMAPAAAAPALTAGTLPTEAAVAPAAAAPETTADTFRLVDGRVDAHLHHARLPAVVARIARAASVELVGGERLADTPVRVDLDGVPVAEALLRLTAGYDCAFAYRDSRLLRMSIATDAARQDDSQQTADAANPDQADPQLRADAVETIALRGGARAREVVAHALADADEDVRLRALEQTQVVKGLALPLDALQNLLSRDVSESVRVKALDVLATDPAVDAYTLTTIARGAEADSSELVRTRAVELRERLEAVSGPTSQ